MISNLINNLNSVIRNWLLIGSLLGVGIFYTIYTGAIQFRKFNTAFKNVFGGMFEKIEMEFHLFKLYL